MQIDIAKFSVHRFFGFRRDSILAARVCGSMPRVENPACHGGSHTLKLSAGSIAIGDFRKRQKPVFKPGCGLVLLNPKDFWHRRAHPLAGTHFKNPKGFWHRRAHPLTYPLAGAHFKNPFWVPSPSIKSTFPKKSIREILLQACASSREASAPARTPASHLSQKTRARKDARPTQQFQLRSHLSWTNLRPFSACAMRSGSILSKLACSKGERAP